jgi:hypothetical protein
LQHRSSGSSEENGRSTGRKGQASTLRCKVLALGFMFAMKFFKKIQAFAQKFNNQSATSAPQILSFLTQPNQ